MTKKENQIQRLTETHTRTFLHLSQAINSLKELTHDLTTLNPSQTEEIRRVKNLLESIQDQKRENFTEHLTRIEETPE